MTVEEAKTKVCPFTLYVEKYKDPIKPHIISYETRGSNCICGNCMAWEWDKLGSIPNEQLISNTDGYCKRIGK